MEITTITGVVKSNSQVYSLSIVGQDNKVYQIKVFGLEKLNGNVQNVNIQGVKELFSQKIQQEWEKLSDRPVGQVELLIGSDNLGLHPTEIETKDNFRSLARPCPQEYPQNWN